MGLLDILMQSGNQAMPVGPLDPAMAAAVSKRQAQPQAQPQPQAVARPDFGGGINGQQILGALLAGVGGPVGNVGQVLVQNAAGSEQAKSKNETYDWLLKQKDPTTGNPISPETAKLIVTNRDVAADVIPRLLGVKAPVSTKALTDNAPPGTMWKDPNNPAMGVAPIPGFEPKPDPIDVAVKRDELTRNRDVAKADDKRLAEVRKQGDGGREALGTLDQLRKAREGVDYEGGVQPGLRTWLGSVLPDSPIPGVGLPFIPSQEEAGKAQQVESLSTEIQLQFTDKTKGAISDREMALFGRATPGLQMSDEGAARVMDGMEAGSLRAREKPKFFEAYRKQNGDLDGADEAWDSFIENSPVLEDDGKGGFKVNKNNVRAWRQFVGGGAGNAAPSTAAPSGLPQGARKAPDGNFYVPDPNRPGKYLQVQ